MAGLAIDDAAWASPWRHRAVADKAVLSFGLLVLALVVPPWPGAVAVIGAAAGLALFAARVPPLLLFRAVRAPMVFVVLGALAVAVTVGGPTPDSSAPVARWGPLAVTTSSLTAALAVLGRGMAGTVSLLLLAATTPLLDLLGALRRWRIPEPLIDIALLIYRLLFSLVEAARSIREAQAARLGYTTATRSYRSAGLLMGVLLVRSWDRARRLEDGLAGRGYTTSLTTLGPHRPWSPRFVLTSVALLVAVAAVAVAPALMTSGAPGWLR